MSDRVMRASRFYLIFSAVVITVSLSLTAYSIWVACQTGNTTPLIIVAVSNWVIAWANYRWGEILKQELREAIQ